MHDNVVVVGMVAAVGVRSQQRGVVVIRRFENAGLCQGEKAKTVCMITYNAVYRTL